MKPKNSADKTKYLCRPERETGRTASRLFLYLITFAALCSNTALSQEVGIKATADRSQIYIGESFNLLVEVSGSNSRKEPDFPNIDNCEIKLLGSQDQSRFSFRMINGQMSRESYTGRTFTYKIKPKKTGIFNVGSIEFRHNSRSIIANGPTLKVSGIEEQDYVLVSVTSSKESVLIDETFEITLSIRMKRLPGQYAHYDPIDPRQPPSVEIPYIREDIGGLKMPDLQGILQERLVRHPNRAGFSINSIELRDKWDFSFFNQFKESNVAKFALNRRDVTINGNDYYEYFLKLKFTALEEKSHTFGPIVFKGQVITSVNKGGNGSGKPIFAIGPACTVRVVPPPEENRPASYIGAVGEDFSAAAELDTQTCNLGDPIKMTISLSGNVRLSNVEPPDLASNKELRKIFRIYSDTIRTETDSGIKKYIYTVRPIKSGTLEIPPIEISFYDTKENAYKTIYTKPIPLRVNEAVRVSENFIIDTGTNRMNGGEDASPRRTLLIAPLAVNESGFVAGNGWLDHKLTAILYGAPALYIMALLISGLWNKRSSTSDSRQRSKQLRSARKMIIKSLSAFSSDKSRSADLLLCGTRKFIAQYFTKPEEGLAPNDVQNLLLSCSLPQDQAEEAASVYEKIFNSAYNSSDNKTNCITKEDIECVLGAIDRLDSK